MSRSDAHKANDVIQMTNNAYEYFEEHENGEVSTLWLAMSMFPMVPAHDLIAIYFTYQEYCISTPEEIETAVKRIRKVKDMYPEWTPTTRSKNYRVDGSETLLQDIVHRLYHVDAWPPIMKALHDAGCDFNITISTRDTKHAYTISEFLLMGEGALYNTFAVKTKLDALYHMGVRRPRYSFMVDYVDEHDRDLLDKLELPRDEE
jgi:hypothetical protein